MSKRSTGTVYKISTNCDDKLWCIDCSIAVIGEQVRFVCNFSETFSVVRVSDMILSPFFCSPPLNTSARSRRLCCQITITPTSLPFTRDSISLSANMAEWREATRPAPPWQSLTSSLEYERDWPKRSRFAHVLCSPTWETRNDEYVPAKKRYCTNITPIIFIVTLYMYIWIAKVFWFLCVCYFLLLLRLVYFFFFIACGYGGIASLLTLSRCFTGHKEILDQTEDALFSFTSKKIFFYYLRVTYGLNRTCYASLSLTLSFVNAKASLIVPFVLSGFIFTNISSFLFCSVYLLIFSSSPAIEMWEHLKQHGSLFLLHDELRCLGIPPRRPFNMHSPNAPGSQK